MDLIVELSGRGDRSARIYQAIRGAILEGRLPTGERLPASRDLATQLGVSRTTVTIAYEMLAAEGFVAGRVGSGTVVLCDRPGPMGSAPAEVDLTSRPAWDRLAALGTDDAWAGPRPAYDLSAGTPDPGLFPLDAWRRELVRAVGSVAGGPYGYGDSAGLPALRASLARHVGISRGARATPETVVVTNGAQGALNLVGRALIEPGTTVAIEDPGFPSAMATFQALGARVVPVPVDREGLCVDALPPDARLVYVTPSHQYPTGVALSLPRRTALLAWAQRHDAILLEDDYDSEFRFRANPLEPLQALDRSGRVVYVGSFSKTMAPFLRLGYLVAPPALVPALRGARRLTDCHGELTTQAAMAGFIDRGRLAWQLRRAHKVYAPRHETLVRAIGERLGPWLELVPSSAGLHVCAVARDGVTPADVEAVLAAARQDGVAARSLARSCFAQPRAGLVLGYGQVPVERIEPAVALLAAAFRATVGPRSAAA